MPLVQMPGIIEEISMSPFFASIAYDLKRLAKLVRRDGPLTAYRKGVEYLKWQIPSQVLRMRMLRLPRAEDRFAMIYRTNMWAAKESVSGPAASLANTENLRRELPRLFARMGIKTILDAPCGDFYWMQHVVRSYPVDYIGGDIVRPMIEANNARFGQAKLRFVHIDVSTDDLPRTDLWLCRGLFSLLSNEDCLNALRQFVRSGTPYILLSTHRNPGGLPNGDVTSGDFRYVYLHSAPFNLPPPIVCLDDRHDEDLCLWSREQVRDAIGGLRQL